MVRWIALEVQVLIMKVVVDQWMRKGELEDEAWWG